MTNDAAKQNNAAPGGRTTMRSIAEKAGVNVSTVSRVLRQRPSRSDSELALRVRRIAADLDYSRDMWAASLRSRRTNAIGVVVTHLTDVVMASVYEAIETNADLNGYLAFGGSSRDEPLEQRRRVEQYLARRVDGLLIGDAHLSTPFLDELAGRDVPFVLFNRRSSGHPSVTWDDELGGRLVAEHFLGLGHSRIAVIAGPAHASTGVDRVHGFIEALRRADVQIPGDMVIPSAFDVEGGRVSTTQLLDRPSASWPTAIFAVNDYAAIGVIGVLRSAGLRVGEDVAVVGYNDISIASDLLVPLTSVKVPVDEMGRVAVEMLLSRINGHTPVVSRRLTPILVPRESSGRRR